MTSIDLSTSYLGLQLANPFMPGASPMVDNLDTVKKLEDAGASAIILHSLFEEQIEMDQQGVDSLMLSHEESFSEAPSYFPRADEFAFTPDRYLDQIAAIRSTVAVPVIASLNGASPGGWVSLAQSMQQAGANALELNIYQLPSDPEVSGSDIEDSVVEILENMLQRISIPVAVKLSPFYSSLPNFATRLAGSGARGLVLFNRFYQPDINIEDLEVSPSLQLSDSSELLLRLRWMAILEGIQGLDFALSGGVHHVEDAVKALMAGATTVQLVSCLLKHGPDHLMKIISGVYNWMEEHEYSSVKELRGSMSYRKCPNPGGYERANYLRVLQTWQV